MPRTGDSLRSLVLTISALVLLGGVAFAYLYLQPGVSHRPSNKLLVQGATTRPQSTTKISGLGTVESAWIIRIDPKTGELASRFRGERYDPQPDNTVLVDQPEAEFFASDGKQRFHLRGRTGRVHVSGVAANQKPGQFAGKMEPPNRGQLHDVVITMFEPADAAAPVMTIQMNNAMFNNEELRVETEAFVDQKGGQVPADQVPVIVRGRDYDFDGRGLVMKWNERDRRLELLEIAHGEKLVIKNPKMLSKPTLVESAMTIEEGDTNLAPTYSAWAKLRSAAKKPAKGRKSPVASAPATKHSSGPTLYRATFNDNVKVLQSDQQVAAADVMYVNFLRESESTTKPAPADRTGDSPASPESKVPTQRHGEKAPTNKPSDGPITINWRGKLRVVPVEEAVPVNLTPGKAQVVLQGNPLTLTQDETQIFCASAVYNSADESAELRGSESIGLIKMTDSSGLVLHTPRMIYQTVTPRLKLATLIGPSSAQIPVEGKANKTVLMNTTWREQCKLRLVSDEHERTFLEHADLTGAVRVDDPKMNVASERMELAFVPAPTTQQANAKTINVQPKQIVASGNVLAKMRDDEGREQTVGGEKLTVDTQSDGKGGTFARRFEVDGKVHSLSREGELSSEHLVALLRPSTRPAKSKTPAGSSPFESGEVDLESLTADRNVRFATTQGAVATGGTLKILTEDQLQRIHLIGTTQPATVVNQNTTITGQRMRFTPDAKLAEIPGAGRMHSTSQPTAQTKKTAPIETDIAWQGGAVINGITNLVDIHDKVVVNIKQLDTTSNTATSDRLQATLAERTGDANKSSDALQSPAPALGPAPAPKTTEGDSLMEAKDITAATLSGNVEVKSELLAPDGTLVQGFNLWTETVTYDRLANRMAVPGAGMMGYQDHRPATKGENEGPTVGTGRGTTAFEWKKYLLYDGTQQKATLNGDVVIVHKPQQRAEQPFRLDAQTVVAQFEEKQDAGAPAPAPAPGENTSVKLITATDQVRVSSTKMSFDAYELTYSPSQALLTARGREGNPGNIYNSDNGSTGIFESLEWNTETDQFKITNASGRMRR